MNKFYALLSVLSGSVCLSACSSQDNDSFDDPIDQNSALVWSSCDDDSLLQCATLDVLSDPSDTNSNTISLAINRLPSIQDNREGVVLVNPGGPGGSGVELLYDLAVSSSLPQSLREKFDFIGFDPRGVGGSTAVDCREFDTTEISEYLADEQAIEQYVENLTNAATSCEQKYGTYLQQLGSQNVVHDMDAIRQATGEETIHFIGYSYGTRLGALYLQTYPEHSGHFVLDGSLKPEPEIEFLVAGAVDAMQASLLSMLDECSSISSDCTGNLLLEQLENKMTALSNDGRDEDIEIVGGLVFITAEAPEFGPFLLPPLYDYLQTDDISTLRDIFQSVQGELSDADDDTAERAVMCADDATRPTASDLNSLLSEFNQRSDFFAEIHIVQAGMCSGWPVSLEALAPVTTSQAPASLVIGGTTDTLTLAQWAEDMALSIGGYYLESDHLGHTSVFNEQSPCVDAIAEAFLLNGLQPLASRCFLE